MRVKILAGAVARLAIGLLILNPASTVKMALAKPLQYTGVNLAGGDFYSPKPGTVPIPGKNLVYPSDAEFVYFASKGMNVVRIPFLWEVLQPELKKPLAADQLAPYKSAVKAGTSKGLIVLLDPHNYAHYNGKVIGGPEVGYDAFADFWRRMALEFRDDPKVWFGLVNEPNGIPTEQWLGAANAAIAAIRKTGAKNLILVPGNAYTGAGTWFDKWYGTPNSEVMLGVKDPLNHYAYDVHQYLDSNNSGTHPEVVSATIGSERLRRFTAWCRTHHKKAFLGEFAVAAGVQQQLAISDMLTSMERDRDVWLGYTWWAAGAWWGDYMFTIEPKDGQDRPQMAYLAPHLQNLKHAVDKSVK